MYPVQTQRPAGVTILAILAFIGGVLNIISGLVFALFLAFDPVLGGVWIGLGGVMIVIGVLYFLVGWGLWNLKPWARTVSIVLAIISLIGFPIGTILGIIILWYLFKPEIKAAFGVGPPVMPYPPPGYPPAPYGAPPPVVPPGPPPAPGYTPPAPAAAAPVGELRCKNCGAVLQPGVAFCPNCGTKV